MVTEAKLKLEVVMDNGSMGRTRTLEPATGKALPVCCHLGLSSPRLFLPTSGSVSIFPISHKKYNLRVKHSKPRAKLQVNLEYP